MFKHRRSNTAYRETKDLLGMIPTVRETGISDEVILHETFEEDDEGKYESGLYGVGRDDFFASPGSRSGQTEPTRRTISGAPSFYFGDGDSVRKGGNQAVERTGSGL